MEVTIKAQPFMYPNFLILPVPGSGEKTISMSVGDAFPTDEAAAKYWDECRAAWIAHVKERRANRS